MSVFKPFKAIRPAEKYADKVAALPYDVYTSEEAYEVAKDNPYSFLHVDKAEIDLEKDIDIYDNKVYQKAASNLNELIKKQILKQDKKDCFYIYSQTMDGRTQTGICGCASIDDYLNNVIKKHENTRKDKEQDRIRHVDACNANTGPIFLTYNDSDEINTIITDYKKNSRPVYDFVSDGVLNKIWIISDAGIIKRLSGLFEKVPALYIADGHHRAASAVAVGKMRRKENTAFTGNEEFNYFLAVAFPKSELAIMDYNRVIKDLNGLSKEDFLKKVSEKFDIECTLSVKPYKPSEPHTFGMYLDKSWYKLTAKKGSYSKRSVVKSLDVSILQDNLISPILGINDPKTDKRIDFVGGIRGLKELEKRANSDMCLAFSMYPTTIDELISIADAKKLMPPKSTWFEPKLLSGLFIHKLS